MGSLVASMLIDVLAERAHNGRVTPGRCARRDETR